MATLWAWSVHLCFVQTSPAGGASSKEMSSRLCQHSLLQLDKMSRLAYPGISWSCLTLFCRNKLSWCPQCAQTHGKTVKAVMAASHFPSIQAATTPARLISLQTIAYIQALGIHSLSYTMALKPLAAKAFVLNRNLIDDVVSHN